MFLYLSVILFTGGCLPHPQDQRQTPPGRHTPRPTPPAQCVLGYTPPAQCMLGYMPSRAVHAGIQSTSRRYASHWNTFLYCFNINFVNTMKRKHSSRIHATHLLTICALVGGGWAGRGECPYVVDKMMDRHG